MAERAGFAFFDAITDFFLPYLGIRTFMRHNQGGQSDPTIGSQDEFLLLNAIESLKEDKDTPDGLRDFIIEWMRYLKGKHRSRMLPRLRETIARAAGKDSKDTEEVGKLLTRIFKDVFEEAQSRAGGNPSAKAEAFAKLTDELDVMLTQRLGANLSDRFHQVKEWIASLDDEACEAADEFSEFLKERKERRANRGS